ncbi:MAG: hypothetical protein BAJALOKI2v1_160034 [Promethearchaeota archaeon]|nr:MAG: hypothetical protein BAJALOKI2v1_160034 [Candidatus Lokiarchaeota archaeon]
MFLHTTYRDIKSYTDFSITTGRKTSEYYLVLELTTTYGVKNHTINGAYAWSTDTFDEKFRADIIMNPEAPQVNIGTFRVAATFFETKEETSGLDIPGYPLFITLSVSVLFIGIIAYISRKKRFSS